MENESMKWISTTGRLLGVAFYYAPDDERIAGMLQFFKQPNWQQEWTSFVDEKTLKKSTALITGIFNPTFIDMGITFFEAVGKY